MAKESNEQLQIELLKAQVENLIGKITKPKNTEEEFAERCAKYDAKQAERNELKRQIDQRRLELMMLPELMGKARMDEVILLESWERRAKSIEKSNPSFAIQLMNQYKRKMREIKNDSMR